MTRLANWGTPCASEYKGCSRLGQRRGTLSEHLFIEEGKGPLSPAWAEVLMGLNSSIPPIAPPANITIGSLFSGIGGLDFGVECSGLGRVLWQCEAAPFPRQVLKKHWPNTTIFGDIKGLHPPKTDILIGGFPCTDISAANQSGQGLAGERSGLWFEMLRIIRENLPNGIIIENVQRLARRGLDRIVAELSSLDYQVAVSTIWASDVGAPHRRARLFILAYHHSERIRLELQKWQSETISRWAGETGREPTMRDLREFWLDIHSWPKGRGKAQYSYEPPRLVAPRSCWHRPARIRGVGNAVLPACAFVAASALMDLLNAPPS